MKTQKILVTFILIMLVFATVVLATDTPTPSTTPESTPSTSPSPSPTPTPAEIKWTDFSKAKLTFVRDESETLYYQYDLKFENITLNADSGTMYYIFMANSSTKPTFGTTREELEKNCTTTLTANSAKEVNHVYTREFIEKTGDIYVWVVETRWNPSTFAYENKEVLSAKKVAKPSLAKLGTRMKAFFFSDKTTTFVYTPYKNENRKINLKIGKVTDKSVLLSIKNGEASCLNKLMDYAKKTNSLYTGSVSIGQSATITNKFDVVDGEYYYVYMQLDSENGTYEPIEEVSLFQGLITSDGKNLSDYLSNEFKWNLTDDPAPSPSPSATSVPTPSATPDGSTATTPLPQTGEAVAIIAILAVIIVAGVMFYVRYRNYKGI